MMKRLLLLLTVCASIVLSSDKPKITPADFSVLQGERWQGTLTYLDYTSNKQVTILADLSVRQSEVDPLIWIFSNEYPKEPHANSLDTVRISSGGDSIDGEVVVKRRMTGNGELLITTTKADGGRLFRYTYLISKAKFSIRKEERGDDDKGYFERNIYRYSRPEKQPK